MRVIDAPLAVLRFQYRIARLPLQVIEERVVARMGSEAPARLFYERSLGLLDAAVGNVLGDSRLAKRGATLAERSDALNRAAELDATAERVRKQSTADLKTKSNKAIEEQRDARAAKDRAIDDARADAEERTRAVDAAAAQRTAAANKKADDVAERQHNSADAAKRAKQARIRASEQKATAAAKSKLDDAQKMRTEADTKRARAGRVEKLADVEKQKRQSARAKNS